MTATLSTRLAAAYRLHRTARRIRQLARRVPTDRTQVGGLPYVGSCYRGPVARKAKTAAAVAA